MNKNIARHISRSLAQSGRAVRVTVRSASMNTTFETKIVAIKKVRGMDIWVGTEVDTGNVYFITGARF